MEAEEKCFSVNKNFGVWIIYCEIIILTFAFFSTEKNEREVYSYDYYYYYYLYYYFVTSSQ